MLKTILVSGVGAGLALTMGCTTPPAARMPSARPLGREIPAFHAAPWGAESLPLPANGAAVETLSLRQALALALMLNPELQAFSHDVRAAEAETLQAALRPNPEIEFAIESFDRDGAGYDSSEPSVMLGQVVELGRKREWRVRTAEARGAMAGWDYEIRRLAVFTETADRFNAVLAAQQRLELTRSSLTLAEESARSVGERVKAGKEPPVQSTKAIAEMELARLDADEAAATLQVSRSTLAAIWGAAEPDFMKASGTLESIAESLPALERLRRELSSHPELARRTAEVQLRQAALESARAGRIPDITVAAGVKRFEEDQSHALIFGIGVPLPLFDRNQGHIAAARHELARARAEERAIEIDLATRLSAAHAALISARNRVRTLRAKVIPALEEAYRATHSGYRQGKYDLLDVLDGQRTLFAMQRALIDGLAAYHTALNAIERLTGMSLAELSQNLTEEN